MICERKPSQTNVCNLLHEIIWHQPKTGHGKGMVNSADHWPVG